MSRYLGDVPAHDHIWGPIQHGRLTGEPTRPCEVPFCKAVTLDLEVLEDGSEDTDGN